MNEFELREIIAKNLRRLMKEHRLNQREFGEKIGVRNEQVSRWMTRKMPPSWHMVAQICTTLDIRPEELLKEDAVSLDDSELRLFQKFRNFQKAIGQ